MFSEDVGQCLDTERNASLGFLFGDPCRMARRVKVCPVLANENEYERVVRAAAAAAKSALAERRGLEMVGDMPEHSAALGLQQLEDFGFVRAQHVEHLRRRRALCFEHKRGAVDN